MLDAQTLTRLQQTLSVLSGDDIECATLGLQVIADTATRLSENHSGSVLSDQYASLSQGLMSAVPRNTIRFTTLDQFYIVGQDDNVRGPYCRVSADLTASNCIRLRPFDSGVVKYFSALTPAFETRQGAKNERAKRLDAKAQRLIDEAKKLREVDDAS